MVRHVLFHHVQLVNVIVTLWHQGLQCTRDHHDQKSRTQVQPPSTHDQALRAVQLRTSGPCLVGLMDGARAGRSGGTRLSSGILSAVGFADGRRRRRQKGSTNTWRICRTTSSLTCYLHSSENRNSGRSSCPERRHSSRKCTSGRYSQKWRDFAPQWRVPWHVEANSCQAHCMNRSRCQPYAPQGSNADILMDDYDEEDGDDIEADSLRSL